MQCTMLPRVESCSKPVDCVGRRGGRCRGGSSAHAGQSLRRGEGRAGVPHARATVSSRAMCPRLLRNASQASGEVYAAAPRRCATTWSPTTASASAGPRSPAGWERASGNPSTVTPGMADGSCGMATAASSWTRCSTCGRARPVPSHPSPRGVDRQIPPIGGASAHRPAATERVSRAVRGPPVCPSRAARGSSAFLSSRGSRRHRGPRPQAATRRARNRRRVVRRPQRLSGRRPGGRPAERAVEGRQRCQAACRGWALRKGHGPPLAVGGGLPAGLTTGDHIGTKVAHWFGRKRLVGRGRGCHAWHQGHTRRHRLTALGRPHRGERWHARLRRSVTAS